MDSNFVKILNQVTEKGLLTNEQAQVFLTLCECYIKESQKGGLSASEASQIVQQLFAFTSKQVEDPYSFEIFHEPVLSPSDYYQFGMDFIRPLIDFKKSSVKGITQLKTIQEQMHAGENVILFANHQTEPDPQIIDLLIEKHAPGLGKQMIFIAGHRVTTDPLAVPFSLGRRLLTVFSKKHISFPPAEKNAKIAHNQKTLAKLQELLSEGGQCIYVAPSGGRDRTNAEGEIEMALFDPQSIELFYLLAQYSDYPTHFYPLAMATYALLPPPQQIEKKIGEERHPTFTSVHLAFGKEIDMESFPGGDALDKKSKREKRAESIWNITYALYKKIELRK